MIQIHLSRIVGDRRLSQMELARMTGIRPSTINDIYHDFVERLNLDHLDRLCEALDCSVADLIEYVPNDKPKTRANAANQNHKSVRKAKV